MLTIIPLGLRIISQRSLMCLGKSGMQQAYVCPDKEKNHEIGTRMSEMRDGIKCENKC